MIYNKSVDVERGGITAFPQTPAAEPLGVNVPHIDRFTADAARSPAPREARR